MNSGCQHCGEFNYRLNAHPLGFRCTVCGQLSEWGWPWSRQAGVPLTYDLNAGWSPYCSTTTSTPDAT